ncbi:MAG: hydroxymethylpyrimidine/phosphomethylpyrimidine kinase [Pseudomonadota bacterium]|nr:hydroxymethylpyrimidine/phosphomethylpyrimidine kinase [Pseudomonadota bacterium]
MTHTQAAGNPHSPTQARPVVLCFAGHDPSGGAGLQADIETLAAHGCHCIPVVTALTDQDSRNLYALRAVDPEWIHTQTRRLLEDFDIRAVKIGLVGSTAGMEAIRQLLDARALRDRLVVLDPVLAAGGGGAFAGTDYPDRLRELLVPRAYVTTPNQQELHALASATDEADAVAVLHARGCAHVLVTGVAGSHDSHLTNRLYTAGSVVFQGFPTQRRPGHYRGTGCSLAAAVAAGLAHRQSVSDAVRHATQWTASAIAQAQRLGHGQSHLTRIP